MSVITSYSFAQKRAYKHHVVNPSDKPVPETERDGLASKHDVPDKKPMLRNARPTFQFDVPAFKPEKLLFDGKTGRWYYGPF